MTVLTLGVNRHFEVAPSTGSINSFLNISSKTLKPSSGLRCMTAYNSQEPAFSLSYKNRIVIISSRLVSDGDPFRMNSLNSLLPWSGTLATNWPFELSNEGNPKPLDTIYLYTRSIPWPILSQI